MSQLAEKDTEGDQGAQDRDRYAPPAGAWQQEPPGDHGAGQAITSPYSSGVNEGRITDVKLQKRLMAGRAKVPLLRQRVVLIARLRRS